MIISAKLSCTRIDKESIRRLEIFKIQMLSKQTSFNNQKSS